MGGTKRRGLQTVALQWVWLTFDNNLTTTHPRALSWTPRLYGVHCDLKTTDKNTVNFSVSIIDVSGWVVVH